MIYLSMTSKVFLFFTIIISLQAFSKVPKEILQISHHENLNSTVLIVDKTERLLYIYQEKDANIILDKTFPVDIGRGLGKKEKRVDLKTPEGIYFLVDTKTQPEIPFQTYGKLAFISDFPNPFDKLEQKTGDGIWLHGVPDTVSLERGSKGCVVVRNSTLDYLKNLVMTGTTALIIKDKIDWVEKIDPEIQKPIFNFFSSWLNSWQEKSNNYFDMYSVEFKSSQFTNLKRFIEHKKNVFNSSKHINIKFDPLLIIQDKNQIIVTGIQIYSGDTLADRGIKTIYLKAEGDQKKIISEKWLPTHFSPTILESLASDTKVPTPTN